MRNASHKTFTGALREAIEGWRKESGWSRETVVMQIVEMHERLDAHTLTGIQFDPPTRDTFERAKVNADRVFRWLDDVTKDTNHCPPNFIPSILATLPMERRLALVNVLLTPLGITCRAMAPAIAIDDNTMMLFKELVATSSEANTRVADLLDGIDPGELEGAHSALCNAMRSISTLLTATEKKMREGETR